MTHHKFQSWNIDNGGTETAQSSDRGKKTINDSQKLRIQFRCRFCIQEIIAHTEF